VAYLCAVKVKALESDHCLFARLHVVHKVARNRPATQEVRMVSFGHHRSSSCPSERPPWRTGVSQSTHSPVGASDGATRDRRGGHSQQLKEHPHDTPAETRMNEARRRLQASSSYSGQAAASARVVSLSVTAITSGQK